MPMVAAAEAGAVPGNEVENMFKELCVAEGNKSEYDDEDDDSPVTGGDSGTGEESGPECPEAPARNGFLGRVWNVTKKVGGAVGGVGGAVRNRVAARLARSSAIANPRLQALLSECRHPRAAEGGGLMNDSTEGIANARSVVAEVVKEMGKKLLTGQNLLSVTFPVRCCQPKTILEVAAGQFVFCPHFLSKAAATPDPVERMKLVVACFVGCIHTTSSFVKPFNPTLGETYQATFAGGTELALEQTSHHPPITSWQLTGPQGCFHYYGWSTYTAGFGYNRMFIKQTGTRICAFNDATQIEMGFTKDRFSNVFWGDPVHEVLGGYSFVDKANNLACRIDLNAFKGLPSDVFCGSLDRIDANGETVEAVCAVEGSWLGFVDFDGERYWDHTFQASVPEGIAAPLPSDARYRQDRVLLAQGDVVGAQENKTRIEERQRRERRLRTAGAKASQAGEPFDAAAAAAVK